MSTPPILRFDALHKTHDQAQAGATVLRQVDLSVAAGEFVCIMGPSGSGKSTLLHLASGLDQPSAGSVRLADVDLSTLPESERTLLRRATIGHVFQFFNLLPDLNVLDNVGLPLAIAGQRPMERRSQLEGLLERVGLAGKAESLPHQLSGGEMQRVSIARALAGGQPLLLCDEPTGNLAQRAGLEIMQLLREVCSEDGRAVLLVTHNPRDAIFADRVRFLVDGALDVGHELRGPRLEVERVHAALSELGI